MQPNIKLYVKGLLYNVSVLRNFEYRNDPKFSDRQV